MAVTPSAQYSLTIRVEIAHRPGMLGRGGLGDRRRRRDDRRRSTSSRSRTGTTLRDITVDAGGQDDWDAIIGAIEARRGRARRRHDRPHVPAAHRRQDRAAQQAAAARRATTSRWPTRPASRACAGRSPRTPTRPSSTRSSATRSPSSPTARRCSASATSAPRAAMPVMEGKAMLFKEFAGVDAFPICLDTKDPDEIVATVKAIAPALRRHQPRGHLGPALLRDRGAAQGRARHPGLPRRPARHRDRRCWPRCSTR